MGVEDADFDSRALRLRIMGDVYRNNRVSNGLDVSK